MCAVTEDDDLAQAEAEIAARMTQARAEIAARRMLNSAVLEALGELNEREQQVLRLRFGRGGGGADAAGVREPRRPLPTAGAGNVQIDLDPDN